MSERSGVCFLIKGRLRRYSYTGLLMLSPREWLARSIEESITRRAFSTVTTSRECKKRHREQMKLAMYGAKANVTNPMVKRDPCRCTPSICPFHSTWSSSSEFRFCLHLCTSNTYLFLCIPYTLPFSCLLKFAISCAAWHFEASIRRSEQKREYILFPATPNRQTRSPNLFIMVRDSSQLFSSPLNMPAS